MQIHFNGTNFINAACIFCLTHGKARSWRNGDALCCQFSDFAGPFRDFFPPSSKKRIVTNLQGLPKSYLVTETHWYCCASTRSCSKSGAIHFACSEEVSCPVLQKCKKVYVSKLLSAKKEK